MRNEMHQPEPTELVERIEASLLSTAHDRRLAHEYLKAIETARDPAEATDARGALEALSALVHHREAGREAIAEANAWGTALSGLEGGLVRAIHRRQFGHWALAAVLLAALLATGTTMVAYVGQIVGSKESP